MKTIKDLAELVETRERDLAYGSETILLGAFVAQYDCTSRLKEEKGETPIPDEEYTAWEKAYDLIKQYETDKTDYNIDMLFD